MAETYFLASKARHKLTKEASRPDLHLRQLVSHANLVDLLMDELAERRSKGKVQFQAAPVAEDVSAAIASHTANTHIEDMSDDSEELSEDDDEYEQVSTGSQHSFQAYESIEEVDEEDDDECDECDDSHDNGRVAGSSTAFYTNQNVSNASVDDMQAPSLYYSSSSDEEEEIEHQTSASAATHIELQKCETDTCLAADVAPFIVV